MDERSDEKINGTGNGNVDGRNVKVDGELLAKYTSAQEYDESRFWRTVGRHAAKWGGKLLEQILTLYYCMMDPATPTRSKTIIAGAIAYMVLPTDLIPDLIPAVGWTDDTAMITWAGIEVFNSIKEEHRSRARTRVASILGHRAPETSAASEG